MVSIDLWRVRIGGWAGRSSPSAPVPERATIQLRIRVQFRMNEYVQLKASGVVQWGISTSVFAVVISILLIIGSVELNPGPVYKNSQSSTGSHVLSDHSNPMEHG